MDKAAQLEQFITQYIDQSQQLLAIISEEKQALKNEDESAIVEVTQRKQALLDTFQQSDRQLLTLLGSTNSPQEDNTALFRQFIAHCDSAKQQSLEAKWQQLGNLLKTCKAQNMVNGAIIAGRLNSIQKSLDLLRYGQSAEAVSYGKDGEVTLDPGK